jgi:hypothetical protein
LLFTFNLYRYAAALTQRAEEAHARAMGAAADERAGALTELEGAVREEAANDKAAAQEAAAAHLAARLDAAAEDQTFALENLTNELSLAAAEAQAAALNAAAGDKGEAMQQLEAGGLYKSSPVQLPSPTVSSESS